MHSKFEDNVLVGTSGWIYSDWKETFYPSTVPSQDSLQYYSEFFQTVEINSSFYHLLSEKSVQSWNERMYPEFQFAAKGSKFITHIKRLTDAEEALIRYFERMHHLKNLKVILWQLPPNFKFMPEKLEAFLKLLPKQYRYAIEFRNESWWNAETENILRNHNAAFVTISHPTLTDAVIDTADFVYARFHGTGKELFRYDYSDAEIQYWAKKLFPYAQKKPVYAFFNNGYDAHAVENAMTLILELYNSVNFDCAATRDSA